MRFATPSHAVCARSASRWRRRFGDKSCHAPA